MTARDIPDYLEGYSTAAAGADDITSSRGITGECPIAS